MPALAIALLLAQAVDVHGLVDVFYAYNAHGSENFLPGTGTTAHRANEVSLNAAALDVALEPKPVGFHLTLAYGTGPEVVHAAEREPEIWRAIYQASVSYTASIGSGLLFEAGIYPSHIGYESFFSKDNWNYTRGYMGEFSPYYQAGLKIAYAFDAHWSAQIHFLNGWQIIEDNNRAKAVGTQIAFAGDRLSVALNTFAGPELPGDDSHWRLFGDVIAQYKATAQLSLGATVDVGRQDRAKGAAAWHGAGLFARLALNQKAALALRAEYYDDADGFLSGTPQLLKDGTVTLELRPAEHLVLKLEGRFDASDAAVFASSKTQALALASAVATF